MSADWNRRVESYLDALQSNVDSVGSLLEQLRLDSAVASQVQIHQIATQLLSELKTLQGRVEQRQQLLSDPQAPAEGTTLVEKLSRAESPEATRQLLGRCRSLADSIELAHQAALSSFVCHYHLADFTNQIVGLLAGSSSTPTYGDTTPQRSGGGLFNAAG